MSVIVNTLPANHGDSILISFTEGKIVRNILIDGGPSVAYKGKQSALRGAINELKSKGESIDLLIITHIDDDHIAGVLSMFGDPAFDTTLVKKVWFNSGSNISNMLKTDNDGKRDIALILSGMVLASVGQGKTLENKLKSLGLDVGEVVRVGNEFDLYGSKLTILSPDDAGLKKLNDNWQVEKAGITLMAAGHEDFSKPIEELATKKFDEDDSIPNGSSIAFLFQANGKKLLMLGDAHPSVVEASLRSLGYSESKKLKVDAVKIAHHGSRKNTSSSLLGLIDCSKYILSTDGSKHGLPDKESLARIIHSNKSNKTNLYFNYKNDVTSSIFLKADHAEYNFECHYDSILEI